MNGITEPLDFVTKHIAGKIGLRAENLSVPIGSIAIGEIVSAVEKKFVRGWLRPVILAIGASTAFVAASKTSNSRLKEEGLIIGADLLINAVKDAVENKNEVIETIKGTVEAVKSGNVALAVSNVAGPSNAGNVATTVTTPSATTPTVAAPTASAEEGLKVIAF